MLIKRNGFLLISGIL